MHPNPLIAFKRVLRLHAGIAVLVACCWLSRISMYFLVGCALGLVMMLTVIIPVHIETRAMLNKTLADLEAKDPHKKGRSQ